MYIRTVKGAMTATITAAPHQRPHDVDTEVAVVGQLANRGHQV